MFFLPFIRSSHDKSLAVARIQRKNPARPLAELSETIGVGERRKHHRAIKAQRDAGFRNGNPPLPAKLCPIGFVRIGIERDHRHVSDAASAGGQVRPIFSSDFHVVQRQEFIRDRMN